MYLCTLLGNWDEIQEEMMMSNVLQRDNVIFAKKLDPLLETSARLNDQKVDMRSLRHFRKYIIYSLYNELNYICSMEQ